jgi:hypothetical protein
MAKPEVSVLENQPEVFTSDFAAPLVMVDEANNNNNKRVWLPSEVGPVRGFFGEVLATLQAELNFSYTLVVAERERCGANVTFAGLEAMLQRHEVDLVVADVAVTESEARDCDFAVPLIHTTYRY